MNDERRPPRVDSLLRAFALVSQLGFTVAAGLGVGMLAGLGLGRWLGGLPGFMIGGVLIGLAGGMLAAYRLLMGFLTATNRDGQDIQDVGGRRRG